ncbi:hypothetical protein L228DRAFT_283160 [Xylona heveae TC161]|uniref:CENP-V/GFA domain-containing protein n=1 Tax=Xylona heveae (strain CBS 132557 / TC161) TaxID=1328760 RepID=A0A165GAR5_XYLHT|nr:hypothetical protein L228DRAFT_283160 [Xylona heveae TC161]KZF21958.1 hypothetical protein L228DRAFT_283160 [Xylona heveae TC161]
MSRERPLRGSCSCGRNQYIVEVPEDSTERAQVFFDRGSGSRRHLATPLSAWLRVPLDWYRSSTYAFFNDESHATIRRVFTPAASPSTKRQFCGYCGTPLSYWTESPHSEADFISLTLGSLLGEDLLELEELGLLPPEAVDDALTEKEQIEARRESDESKNDSQLTRQRQTLEDEAEVETEEEDAEEEKEGALGQQLSRVFGTDDGFFDHLPWFESLIDGSKLGRLSRRSAGQSQSQDGNVRVEWEIAEWNGGEDEEDDDDGDEASAQKSNPGKRKLVEIEEEDDGETGHQRSVAMRESRDV